MLRRGKAAPCSRNVGRVDINFTWNDLSFEGLGQIKSMMSMVKKKKKSATSMCRMDVRRMGGQDGHKKFKKRAMICITVLDWHGSR